MEKKPIGINRTNSFSEHFNKELINDLSEWELNKLYSINEDFTEKEFSYNIEDFQIEIQKYDGEGIYEFLESYFKECRYYHVRQSIKLGKKLKISTVSMITFIIFAIFFSDYIKNSRVLILISLFGIVISFRHFYLLRKL